MLRSRNRQQRASESTDEQQGRGGNGGTSYNYGGYPSSSSGTGASPMIGIASGADDDYSYGGQPKKGGGRSRFGFGNGGGAGAKKAPSGGASSFGNRNNAWDKRSTGGTMKGPKNNSGTHSAGFILFAVAFILLGVTGGATFHYRRMIGRMEHELLVLKRRGKTNRFHRDHREELDQDEEEMEEIMEINDENKNDNPNDNNQEGDMADMRQKKGDLEGQIRKWETRSTSMENEISQLQTQMDHLQDQEDGDLFMLEKEILKMQSSLVTEVNQGKEYKEQFIAVHKSGTGGIVPGGPGHALVQRKEIERMENIDDYEDYVQRREDALWDKIDLLVEKIGKESRREATEWFGPGPHIVELEIEYPQYIEDKSPTEWPLVRGVLKLEMAPLPLMAVSVNLFLQQVHHKLWNGCSFVINAMHILQAGPHQYSEGGGYNANYPELVSRFESARLDKMPFQEYHHEFPHDKYTVGFAGRPGGPDFYINKVNNSANHGPGGQSHHDLHEEADPCFAKLVGGMGILDELNKIPVDHDKGDLLLHPVVIVDSRVVSSREEETKQQQNNDGNNNNNAVAGSEDRGSENNDQGGNEGNQKMPAMGPSRGI
mmetsp:Transcript_15289/g.33151  ORF Transcript_15289/g.33151 Transcript_15289/m.33151 type:complete len:599 (+) Transcript_15289:136-1932(+)|eukprot:CAMPEP_0172307502 /NCGR_PEP_ID=MMETSP1058-20130122/8334_1 /TAXON_ID=83371 /ORGANISM="Detonula confervacea, Strain CCMP 353" /LENGTH=598 /DNA_ID=CAMNT_0013019681 /DNA_START=120 /DNA_END=1916 /DNA_ORIENTATION=+